MPHYWLPSPNLEGQTPSFSDGLIILVIVSRMLVAGSVTFVIYAAGLRHDKTLTSANQAQLAGPVHLWV